MLIVLNGPQTVNKAAIAREIITSLNTFSIGGFRIDLSLNELKIYNSSNEIVYGPEVSVFLRNEDNSPNEEHINILSQAEAIRTSIESLIKDNHFYNIFADDQYDWGFTDIINAPMDGQDTGYEYLKPHTYDDVLANYANRPFDNIVISGSFSKRFITKLTEDLGTEVYVLNITRNPSVVFLLSYLTDAQRVQTPAGPIDKGRHRRILVRSITSTVILKDIPGVQTIKFEKLIKAATFKVNGVSVPLPYPLRSNNKVITHSEYMEAKSFPLTDADIAEFNRRYSNFELERAVEGSNGELQFISMLDQLAAVSPEKRLEHGASEERFIEALKNVPRNLFAAIDYQPLTLDEIFIQPYSK